MGLDSTRLGSSGAGIGREQCSGLRPPPHRGGLGFPAPVPRTREKPAAALLKERSSRVCGLRAGREEPKQVHLHAMAVEFPEVAGHPNRLPFEGVLTLVDVASDKAPSGSRGHRVVLTRDAAQAALPSLLGMAVGYKAGWDGHDARQKCGIITAAELEGQRLMVRGFLFARDFPEFAPANARDAAKAADGDPLEDGAMGMSYELADAHVADMRASVWTLTRATFTGAAILLREKAAYRSTSFRVKRPGCASKRQGQA